MRSEPLLYRWVKAHVHANEAHYIVWQGRDALVAVCQAQLRAVDAALVRHGARCCPGCYAGWRARQGGGTYAGMGNRRRR